MWGGENKDIIKWTEWIVNENRENKEGKWIIWKRE